MKANTNIYAVATGTGSCIPSVVVKNSHFTGYEFMNEDGSRIETPGEEIVNKFQQITDIRERRYAEKDQTTSDLGTIAARQALEAANFDPEQLDYIIFAHNMGEVKYGTNFADFMPTLASRVKHKLDIKNPKAVAYDITFGCPGWIQAAIQADYYIKSGDAKAVLVIGGDTLSRCGCSRPRYHDFRRWCRSSVI